MTRRQLLEVLALMLKRATKKEIQAVVRYAEATIAVDVAGLLQELEGTK